MRPLVNLYWKLYLHSGLGIAALLSISQFSFSPQGHKLALNIVILAIFWLIHRWVKTHRVELDIAAKRTKLQSWMPRPQLDSATQLHYREVRHSQRQHLN